MADGCLTRTLEGDELDCKECGEVRTRGGRTNGQTSFGEEGDGRKLTRRTIFMRSSGSVFGSLLEEHRETTPDGPHGMKVPAEAVNLP